MRQAVDVIVDRQYKADLLSDDQLSRCDPLITCLSSPVGSCCCRRIFSEYVQSSKVLFFCEFNCLVQFIQVGIAGGKGCRQMFFIRCIKELSGSMETFFRTGDKERIARRSTANTRSQVQAEDLEVIADAIEVAMEAKMVKSKSVLTRTWPAPHRSKTHQWYDFIDDLVIG